MNRAYLKNNAGNRLAKVLAVLIVITTAIGMTILLISWAERQDQKEHLRQKECWNAVYAIIENSPREKADWIKQTIANRVTFLGGVDYCRALEFIKDGQEHKPRPSRTNYFINPRHLRPNKGDLYDREQ